MSGGAASGNTCNEREPRQRLRKSLTESVGSQRRSRKRRIAGCCGRRKFRHSIHLQPRADAHNCLILGRLSRIPESPLRRPPGSPLSCVPDCPGDCCLNRSARSFPNSAAGCGLRCAPSSGLGCGLCSSGGCLVSYLSGSGQSGRLRCRPRCCPCHPDRGLADCGGSRCPCCSGRCLIGCSAGCSLSRTGSRCVGGLGSNPVANGSVCRRAGFRCRDPPASVQLL